MVKEEVRALVDSGRSSQRKIAGAIGVSITALSQYLNGKYPGDNKSIEDSLSAFLDRVKSDGTQQKILFYPDGIVETQTTRLVRKMALRAEQDGEICVICGEAGSGKTSGIKAYAYQNGGTITITANAAYTQRALFSEIAESVGESPNGTILTIVRRIERKLKGVKKTIIVDEAEHLPYKALDLLRSLQDECKFGLVMVGTKKLYYNLKGNQNQYSQLYSRIAAYQETKPMNEKDAENGLSLLGLNKITAVKCAEEVNGNFRSAAKLAKNAKLLSEINGMEIDAACIAKAKSALVI